MPASIKKFTTGLALSLVVSLTSLTACAHDDRGWRGQRGWTSHERGWDRHDDRGRWKHHHRHPQARGWGPPVRTYIVPPPRAYYTPTPSFNLVIPFNMR